MIKILKTNAVRLRSFAATGTGRLDADHPEIRDIKNIQSGITPEVIKQPGVFGTGIGLDNNRNPVLQIYVDKDHANSEAIVNELLNQYKDVELEVHVREKFKTQAKSLIPCLGVSGSLALDIIATTTVGNCCSGTLGCLVWMGGLQYILSNWHVLEGSTYEVELCTSWADVPIGGQGECGDGPCGSCLGYTTFTRPCATGDPVVSPGVIDVDFPCSYWATQIVGFLEKKFSLPGSNVDCAVAQLRTGLMRSDGFIRDIGVLSSATLPAALGQAVQKSGRTTDRTTGTVSSINASISVDYSDKCGGATTFSKLFTNQILIAPDFGSFSEEGDSGSLVVEAGAANPRAIGLLYAGSSTSTACNPIDEVLSFLGATMVGV